MKKNTLKRVLAGSLALLTVAAYFPANVGDLITSRTAIVASARDAAIEDAKDLNTIDQGDYFEEAATLRKADADTTHSYTVVLTAGDFKNGNNPLASDTTTTISDVTAIEYAIDGSTKQLKITGTFTKESGAASGTEGGATEVTTKTYTLADDKNEKFIRVTGYKSETANGVTTTILTLGAETVAAGVALNFETVQDYIQSMTFTAATSGKEKTYDTAELKDALGIINAKQKTPVTVKATAQLSGGAISEYLTEYDAETGVYTYVFNALDKITFGTTDANFTIDGTATVTVLDESKATETTEATTIGNDTKVPVGAWITIASAQPFTIKDGAVASYDKTNGFTFKDVHGVYSDGQFKATFSYVGNKTITLGTFPTTITYSASGNKVTASDLSTEQIITNVEVASIGAVAYTPNYKADGHTVLDYTETEIANGGSVGYSADENAKVKLNLDVDPLLIGKSNEQVTYKIVLTKDEEDVGTLTYIPASGSAEQSLKLTYLAAESKTPTTIATVTEIQSYLFKKGFDCSEFIATSDGKSNFKDLTKGLTFITKNAGSYHADLTVWSKNNEAAASTASYDYTVNPITEISDPVLTATTGGNKITNIVLNDIGVYEVPISVTGTGDVPSVTLNAPPEDNNNLSILLTGGTTLGELYKVNTATLSINDPNYDVDDVKIQWMLVEAAVDNSIYFDTSVNYGSTTSDPKKIECSIDNVDTVVRNCLMSTNGIDVSNATFKFTKGSALDPNVVDIDSLNNGLPDSTFISTNPSESEYKDYYDYDGDGVHFYVYATVDTFETAKPLEIVAKADVASKVDVNAVLTKTEFVFGETIQPEDIGFVNASNGSPIDGLTAASFTDEGANGANITIRRIKNADGKDVSDTNVVNNEVGTTVDSTYLTPGTYTAIIEKTNGSATTAGVQLSEEAQKIYSVKYAGQGATLSAAEKAAKQEALTVTFTVAKKELEDYMAGECKKQLINNYAKIDDNYLNTQKTVTGVVKQQDSYDSIDVTIIDGEPSAKTYGTYYVTVKPTGNSAKLYTGTCSVHWSAVASENDPFQLAVDTDNYNLYDDQFGLTINVEATISANAGQPELKNADDLKIKSFGLLYQKNGDLGQLDSSDYATKQAEVEKKFRYGYGYTETNATLNGSNGLKTGIGAKVSTIEDYIWIRPYAVTETGEIVYGDAEYVDFLSVSQKVVNPQLDDDKLKIVQYNDKLYYYSYATKTTKTDESNAKTVEPKAFGVVISRTGNYADIADIIDTEGTYTKTETKGDSTSTVKYTIPKITIADVIAGKYDNGITLEKNDGSNTTITVSLTDAQLAAQKAWIDEIKNVAANLTLDTCDIKSAAVASEYYNTDECGTLFGIRESISNAYVRTYVDYGNGLVVYSDPKVIQNASAQLAKAIDLKARVENNDGKNYKFTAEKSTDEEHYGTVAGSGFSFNTKALKVESFEAFKIDLKANDTKDGSADTSNRITAFGLVVDKDGASSSKSDLVLNNGYLDLHKTSAFDSADKFAAVTKLDNIKARGRAYAVYKNVTIYSNNVADVAEFLKSNSSTPSTP